MTDKKTVVSVETSPDNNFEQEFRHVLDRYIDHLMMDGADFQESYQRGSELATENIFFRIGETLGKMADEGYVPARPGADDAFFVQGEPRITNITEFGNSMRGLYHIGLVERDEYSEPDFQREVDASLEILSKSAREVPEISFRTAYESAQEGYMNKF